MLLYLHLLQPFAPPAPPSDLPPIQQLPSAPILSSFAPPLPPSAWPPTQPRFSFPLFWHPPFSWLPSDEPCSESSKRLLPPLASAWPPNLQQPALLLPLPSSSVPP